MKPLNEMTPEEIRLEIAERKGYENIRTWGIKNVLMVYGGQEPGLHHNLPNWPESIAAAWELFEELPIRRELLVTNYKQVVYECASGWSGWDFESGGPGKYAERGDTAPLAICRAWLAWKRSEDK